MSKKEDESLTNHTYKIGADESMFSSPVVAGELVQKGYGEYSM